VEIKYFMLCTLAMWKRDLKRYTREKSQIFSTLATSLLWLILFGIGIGSMQFRRVDVNYQAFIFPGVIGMAVLVTSIRSGISIIRDRESGYLRALLSTPAHSFALISGKLLGGVTVNLFLGVIILIFGALLKIEFSLSGALYSLIIIALSSLVFLTLGIVIASVIESLEGFNLIMSLLIMPMFFTSGALFPVFILPEWMKILAKINPLSYCIDALREVLLGFPPPYFGIPIDIAALSMTFLVSLLAASKIFHKKF